MSPEGERFFTALADASEAPENGRVRGRVPVASPVSEPSSYTRKALDDEAAKVRSAVESTRNDTLNQAAFALGQLIAGGELPRDLVDSELTAAALAAGLGADEIVKTIASGIAAGVREPRAAPPTTRSHATKLVEFAHAAPIDLFHTPDGEAFATIPVGSHRETLPLRNRTFDTWLRRLYHERDAGGVPGNQAVADAIGLLNGEAQFDGPEMPVHVRVAKLAGDLYIDLGDTDWQAVHVTRDGWRVVSNPDVRFRRPRGFAPLPEPVRGGSINLLRPFVNVRDTADFRLLASWLVAVLHADGPHPVLVLNGEQGSAKSTTARVLRSLVDPNTAALRAAPRNPHDLIIAATNAHVVALDNISGLSPWLSDAICRLATGGGFSARELYTDADERLFDAMKPVILNGITDLATRSDLLDRSIIVTLPPIFDAERRTETEFQHALDTERPRIFGALLDAVSHALRESPNIQLAGRPRMADFAIVACAAAPAFGWSGDDFLRAYETNRARANVGAIEASPVAAATLAFMETRTTWEGTAGELLDKLREFSESAAYQLPKSPRGLTSALNRCVPNLRRIGITVERLPRGKSRPWRIARVW